MKPGKTWLHAAARAQEMNKLGHQRRVHDAWSSLLDAAEREQQAASRLGELSSTWNARRGAVRSDAAMEVLYRRFDAHLRGQADTAAQARVACHDQWELAAAELERVHSTQRVLERIAERVAAEQRREAVISEMRAGVEAWLFGRIAGRADEPLESGDADAPCAR